MAGAALLVGLAGSLFVRDVTAVRDSLLAAQTSLVDVRAAAGTIDVDAAARALERADAELGRARSRTGGPLWSLAGALPVAADSVEATRAVVAVASAAIDVAEQAVTEGEALLGGGLDIQVDDGRIDLAPLIDARDMLAGLPMQRLVDARDRLEDAEPEWAPEEVLDGREQVLELADEAIGSIERGRALLDALPGFLGTDEPRSYFLAVQTPAELRGTGGLIGYWAVLRVENGRFEVGRSDVYDALEDATQDRGTATGEIAQLAGDVSRPVPAPPEFAARYDHAAARALFSNVNLDPDFPTVAQVALDLFEDRTGERLDGMVAIDPVAMQALLVAAGGVLTVPDGVVVPEGVPTSLVPQDFAQFVMVDIYETLGDGHSAERKAFLRYLGDAAFARIFDGAWDGVSVGKALADAAGSRHLQVYSNDEGEQSAFGEVGVTGALVAPEGADFLAVTANNAVGGKQDVHLTHHITGEIVLSDPRRAEDGQVTMARTANLRIEVENPLPSEGMDTYIIGNCIVGKEDEGCFDGPPGTNRTWFSVWTPRSSALVAARGDDGGFGAWSGTMHGLQVFDHYLETQPLETAGFEVSYAGRAPALAEDGRLVYELAWWAQSKATPMLLDVVVHAPDGWRVAAVEVIGGGSGMGMGPLGGGDRQVAQRVSSGHAQLRGTASADSVLRVVMTGAEAS